MKYLVMSEDKNALKWYRNKKVSKTGFGFPRHSLRHFFFWAIAAEKGTTKRESARSVSVKK